MVKQQKNKIRVGIMLTVVPLLMTLVCTQFTRVSAQDNSLQPIQSVEALQFVAAGMADAQEELRQSSCVFSYSGFQPKEFISVAREADQNLPQYLQQKSPATGDININMKGLWFSQGSALVMQVDYKDDPTTSVSEHLVADDTQAKILFRQKIQNLNPSAEKPTGVVTNSRDIVQDGMWRPYSHIDPRSYVYYEGGRPISKLLTDRKLDAKMVGQEIVNGDLCWKFTFQPSPKVQSIYWIDTKHSFLVRKSEEWSKYEGKMALVREMNVAHLLESNGIWFPASIEVKQFWKEVMAKVVPSADYKGVKEFLPIVDRIEVSSFKAGDKISPQELAMEWPIGTVVHDAINSSDYIVTVVEQDELLALDAQRKELNKPNLGSSPISTSELAILQEQKKKQKLPELKNPVKVNLEQKDFNALSRLRKQRNTPESVTKTVQPQVTGVVNGAETKVNKK